MEQSRCTGQELLQSCWRCLVRLLRRSRPRVTGHCGPSVASQPACVQVPCGLRTVALLLTRGVGARVGARENLFPRAFGIVVILLRAVPPAIVASQPAAATTTTVDTAMPSRDNKCNVPRRSRERKQTRLVHMRAKPVSHSPPLDASTAFKMLLRVEMF